MGISQKKYYDNLPTQCTKEILTNFAIAKTQLIRVLQTTTKAEYKGLLVPVIFPVFLNLPTRKRVVTAEYL